MIKANNFSLDKVGKHLVARCDISGPHLPNSLWFAAENDDETSLEIEEPNWAAVSLIYPAMGLGHDLEIDAAISPRLLYNLNHDFQDLVQTFNPNLKKIKVIAHKSEPKIYGNEIKRHSITGFSGGADSSATYALYSGKNVPASMRITALSIYDVGALGKTPKEPSFEHLRPHYDGLKRFCEERQIEAFGIASNLREIFRPVRKHHPTRSVLSATISFRNIAATLAMQTRVKNYYPSGNSGFADLTAKYADSTESFEPVIDLLLSTESVHFQTGAGGMERSEKIRLLAETDFAQTGLDVCVIHDEDRENLDFLNCGKCWKCIDTQIESEAMGILHKFSGVFDINSFRKNRDTLFDSFVNNGAYDDRKRQIKLNTFCDLYRSHGIAVPAKLAELTIQANEADPQSSPDTPKILNGPLKRFLAKLR